MKSLDEKAREIGLIVHDDATANEYVYALVVADRTGSFVATNMDAETRARFGNVLARGGGKVKAVMAPRGGKG